MKLLKTLSPTLFLLLLAACTTPPQETDDPEIPAGDTTIVITPGGPVNTIRYVAFDKTLKNNQQTDVWIDSVAGIGLKFTVTNTHAGVTMSGCEIFDSLGLGYPDALRYGNIISPASDKWSSDASVIGTDIGHAGKFEDAGIRHLGFRFPASGGGHHYGWIELNCHEDNNKLEIGAYAYSKVPDTSIIAGQVNSLIPVVPDTPDGPNSMYIAGPDDIFGVYRSAAPGPGACNIVIKASSQPGYDFTVEFFHFVWPHPDISGRIIDGKLVIPYISWEGNIPSPGGTPRPYAADFSGSGILYHNPDTAIVWGIDYDKTGFLPHKLHGAYKIYKCN